MAEPQSGSRGGQGTRLSASQMSSQYLRTRAELVEIVRPILHHADPLVPMFAARISAANCVALDMRELAFDRVGVPLTRLIEKGARHRAETMSGHFRTAIAQPS